MLFVGFCLLYRFATISKLQQAAKLSTIASKIKGIFKAGRRKYLSDNVLDKVLFGKRKSPLKNDLIGGHSGSIDNISPKYVVEEIGYSSVNPSCRKVKYLIEIDKNNLSKIKKSTLFPDNWDREKIKLAIEKIANDKTEVVKQSTGTSYKIGTHDGVNIQVTFDEMGEISGGFPL